MNITEQLTLILSSSLNFNSTQQSFINMDYCNMQTFGAHGSPFMVLHLPVERPNPKTFIQFRSWIGVHPDHVGFVIGRKCATIKKIAKDTKCWIQIQEKNKFSNFPWFLIKGDLEENVCNAYHTLRTIANEAERRLPRLSVNFDDVVISSLALATNGVNDEGPVSSDFELKRSVAIAKEDKKAIPLNINANAGANIFTIRSTEKIAFMTQMTCLGLSDAVAKVAWDAKNIEVFNEKMAAERLTLEKDAGVDKMRAAIIKKQKEIESLMVEIKDFEKENESYYAVKKIGGGGSKYTQEQKTLKKLRAAKRKLIVKNGGGVKCVCGKTFQKENSFYKKCMIKCKEVGKYY